MIIEGVNLGTIYGVTNRLREMEINNELSSFIVDNYDEVVKKVKKMGVQDSMVEDLVHDVYISYIKNEEVGDGYDSTKGRTGSNITVEQAVYGRLKGYSKNDRYKKPTEAPKTVKKKDKMEYEYKEVASTSLDTDVDRLSPCQKFYNQCASVDNIEDIEEKQSLAEQLAFVLSFESSFNVSLKGFFENLDEILDNIGNVSPTLFKEFGNSDEEFKEALYSVLNYSFKEPEYFKETLSKLLV